MPIVLVLHIVCILAWFSSALVRRLGVADARLSKRTAQALARNDLFLELPCFLGAMLTGGALADPTLQNPLVAMKVAAGWLAIGVAVYALSLAPPKAGATASLGLRGTSSVPLMGVAMSLAISLHLLIGI